MTQLHPSYSYVDYREYLVFALEKEGRGTRNQLAAFLNCQSSFISQVLSEKNELSLEHAFRMNQFFKHEEGEKSYFMTMVQLSRSGSEELRSYFRDILENLRTQQMQVHKVIKTKELSKEDILGFYSNWLYVSIHLLVSIPKYQNPKKLQEKLNISDQKLREALDYMVRLGLIVEDKTTGKLANGEAHIHLKKTSPYAQVLSVMTRLRVIEKLKLSDPSAINYSLAFTLPESSYFELKKRLLDLIGEMSELIDKGVPDKLCTFVVDLIEH